MARQQTPAVHGLLHGPNGPDPLPLLSQIHQIGLKANMPAASQGDQSGVDAQVTNGSASVTIPSGNFGAGLIGAVIQFSTLSTGAGPNSYTSYVISAVPSTTTLTLSANYTGATGTAIWRIVGFQNTDAQVTNGSPNVTIPSGQFDSGMDGASIVIYDSTTTPPTLHTYTISSVSSSTAIVLTASYAQPTQTTSWLVGPPPSNAGTTYWASDGTDAPTGSLYESDGVQWHVIGGAGSGGSGFQFNSGTYGADNVGDWYLVEADNTITGDFTKPSGVAPGLITGTFSWGLNGTFGGVITADPQSSNTALNIYFDDVAATQSGSMLGLFIETNSEPSGVAHNPGAQTTQALEADAYSSDHSATGIGVAAASDTGAAIGLNISASIGTVGGAGTGSASGGNITALSQAGNATGLTVTAGDPTSYTTAGAVKILECVNYAGGSSTFTTIFEVVRPTTGNHNATVFCHNLPTSSVGLASGALWNNGGVVNVV